MLLCENVLAAGWAPHLHSGTLHRQPKMLHATTYPPDCTEGAPLRACSAQRSPGFADPERGPLHPRGGPPTHVMGGLGQWMAFYISAVGSLSPIHTCKSTPASKLMRLAVSVCESSPVPARGAAAAIAPAALGGNAAQARQRGLLARLLVRVAAAELLLDAPELVVPARARHSGLPSVLQASPAG